MTPSAVSSHFLNTSRDSDSTTTSLGSPFRCLTTPSMNKFLLMSNLNLPCYSLSLSPLILFLVAWVKRSTPTPYNLFSDYAVWKFSGGITILGQTPYDKQSPKASSEGLISQIKQIPILGINLPSDDLSGVFQITLAGLGSVLGPVLFNISVSDTDSGIEGTFSKFTDTPSCVVQLMCWRKGMPIQRDLARLKRRSYVEYCIQPWGPQHKKELDLLGKSRGGHKNDQSAGAPPLRRQAERVGFVRPGEEESPGRP
ncbi:hypothetical protein BTVI_110056 [Pitangus sulphuratus]|nr:hypothetical protein BTVI_110056 [Pitangus sulphuratus]